MAIRKSHESAISEPPPSAKPSTIAMVGLLKFQTYSQTLSSKIGRISTLDLPSNSEISAPATKECGFGRFPSGGASGGEPVNTMTRTLSLLSAQPQADLMAALTSAFSAFNLFGRLMVQIEIGPPAGLESSTGTFSIFRTADSGGVLMWRRRRHPSQSYG